MRVHGRQSNVATNAGSGDGALDGNGSGGKYARRGTSGAVVAVFIECTSAGAGAWAKREREPKPTKEQDPKVGREDGYILRGRQHREGPRGVWPGL